MAVVTITLTDLPNGEVGIGLVAAPPIEKGKEPTPAQRAGESCVRGIAVDFVGRDGKYPVFT